MRWTPAAITLTLAFAFTAAAGAESWDRFRGPNGSGVSLSTGLPTEFGPSLNEIWAAEVPFGRSSPVVGRDRIFLTAVVDSRLVTFAFDRKTGEMVWRREIERRHVADLHTDTDSATATPVTDGTNVYAFFHEAGLVSYDGEGAERWRLPLGPFRNFYGCASSPVLARDQLLMICDQASDSFLVAIDAESGRERWRAKRPGRLESYATPLLYPSASDPEQVVVSGSRWVDAYELEDGRSAWTQPAVGTGPVASPILVGDTLFVSAHDHADDGWPEFGPLLAEHDADEDGKLTRLEVDGAWMANHFGWLDNDADGFLTADDWRRLREEVINDSWGVFAIDLADPSKRPRVRWNYRQNIPYIPTPLVYDGIYYMVKDGIVSSLDPAGGELVKRGRLPGSNKVYASPVAADGKIYIATLGGVVHVLEAGSTWRVARSNDLGEPIHATPAIADGQLYLRTASKLYSFGLAPGEAND